MPCHSERSEESGLFEILRFAQVDKMTFRNRTQSEIAPDALEGDVRADGRRNAFLILSRGPIHAD
jgi:hypothetical protein